jgi:hypothetical protein
MILSENRSLFARRYAPGEGPGGRSGRPALPAAAAMWPVHASRSPIGKGLATKLRSIERRQRTMSQPPATKLVYERRFAATDPEIAHFVEWIRGTEQDIWLYYLTDLGFMAHLGKYRSDSPFNNVEPIFAKVFSLIRQEFDELNFFEILSFMQALERHIADNRIIENTFDYSPPG